jgi:HlyD family secretion protein
MGSQLGAAKGTGMKIKHWAPLIVVVLSGASIFGWSYLRNAKTPEYQTAKVTVGDIASSVAATGNLNAVVTVQVGSQVSGNIKALYADFNTKVSKGQLVAVIDPELFQARVNQARANLDVTRASILNAQAAVTKAQADVSGAKAALESVKAQLAKAEADLRDADVKLQRRLKLLEKGLISKEECDTAQATDDANAATVQAVQAQIKAAQDTVSSAEAQHDLALAQTESVGAQIRQFQAALAQAELDLEHTQIRAPVEGTVIARHMDVGQTVAASFQAPTIFEIAQDLTKMQVDTNVDEADVSQVQVGQRATFTVDAFPGTTFPANVTQIRQAAINVQNVITYDVVLSVDNSQLRLLPGMTANVRILTTTVKGALKIPNAALRFKPTGTAQGGRKERGIQTIHVLESGGGLRPIQVTTGLSDGSFTAVSSNDLHAGDLVVTGSASASRPSGPTPPPRGPGF